MVCAIRRQRREARKQYVLYAQASQPSSPSPSAYTVCRSVQVAFQLRNMKCITHPTCYCDNIIANNSLHYASFI